MFFSANELASHQGCTRYPGGMFVTPRYGDGALADLVPSVLGVLGVPGETDRVGLGLDGVHQVAVLLVDGMGAELVAARHEMAPFLAACPGRIIDGRISQHHRGQPGLAGYRVAGRGTRTGRVLVGGPRSRPDDEPARMAVDG